MEPVTQMSTARSPLGIVGESLLEALKDASSFTLAAKVFVVAVSIMVLVCSQMNLQVSTVLLRFGDASIRLPESIVSLGCPVIDRVATIRLPRHWRFHDWTMVSLCIGSLAFFSVAIIACLLSPFRRNG